MSPNPPWLIGKSKLIGRCQQCRRKVWCYTWLQEISTKKLLAWLNGSFPFPHPEWYLCSYFSCWFSMEVKPPVFVGVSSMDCKLADPPFSFRRNATRIEWRRSFEVADAGGRGAVKAATFFPPQEILPEIQGFMKPTTSSSLRPQKFRDY